MRKTWGGHRHGVRREIKYFARTMEDRLQANDHKGGWKECSLRWLLQRLREETKELQTAMREDAPEWIRKEAADVANFAMMIADNSMRSGRTG